MFAWSHVADNISVVCLKLIFAIPKKIYIYIVDLSLQSKNDRTLGSIQDLVWMSQHIVWTHVNEVLCSFAPWSMKIFTSRAKHSFHSFSLFLILIYLHSSPDVWAEPASCCTDWWGFQRAGSEAVLETDEQFPYQVIFPIPFDFLSDVFKGVSVLRFRFMGFILHSYLAFKYQNLKFKVKWKIS